MDTVFSPNWILKTTFLDIALDTYPIATSLLAAVSNWVSNFGYPIATAGILLPLLRLHKPPLAAFLAPLSNSAPAPDDRLFALRNDCSGDGCSPRAMVYSPQIMDVSKVKHRLAGKGKPVSLVDRVDFFRIDAFRKLNPDSRSKLGQYPTPPPVARFMASMFQAKPASINLLDAGAGVGSLTAAFVEDICNRDRLPVQITATAFEIEPSLAAVLPTTLTMCADECKAAGIRFHSELHQGDFIRGGLTQLLDGLFTAKPYNCVIMNPPYSKIGSTSEVRRLLREVGIETGNLYTAFLAIAIKLLADGGELVAITPRSFCNGPYFKPFRKLLLETMAIQRVHSFESRDIAFQDDNVLQENVILHAIKKKSKPRTVLITSSNSPVDPDVTIREVDYSEVVKSDDPDSFIHIVADEFGKHVALEMGKLTNSLADIGLEVSTGRVVDFRATAFLRKTARKGTVPLIYPVNLVNGFVDWPRETTKPQAIWDSPGTASLLVPSNTYVLVKRFSAKEEKRRIVAAVYSSTHAANVGFENHLNYFHESGQGLPSTLAKGLTLFLNSTLADSYFRQFNGHTQVNATDLRSLKYPSRSQLMNLGAKITDRFPEQAQLDRLVEKGLLKMEDNSGMASAQTAKRKIDEALEILKLLGLPKAQQNERSALTLLSLIDLKPETPWQKAGNPLMGITPMMDFFAAHYGKKYAPNTRETVRRQTIHQFLQAGLVVLNPDKIRPTNSPDNVYQIEQSALELLRSFGAPGWAGNLNKYLELNHTLSQKYAAERKLTRVSVTLPDGTPIQLSAGAHNVLIKHIVEDFCGYYTPSGEVIYLGDTGDKYSVVSEKVFAELGISIDPHGKMPDVVVYFREKKWLVLIEAVTSHGPVDAKRHTELKELFKSSKAGLVFVTAFLDRKTMTNYLDAISWETEVWVADAPTHIIHFNGERFLGPYE